MTIHRAFDAPFGTVPFERDPVRWMESCDAFTLPQQDRSREALRRIITAAVKLFAERGYVATRVSDIAAMADVPVGTVYQRFRDKEALLSSVITAYRAFRMSEITNLCNAPEALAATPRQMVELHLDIVFSAFATDSGLLRLLERQRIEDPDVHRDQSQASETVAGLIADRLIEKMPDRDPAQLRREVFYVHSIIRGAVVWSTLPPEGEWSEGLKITDTGFREEALTIALRYLRLDR